MTYFWDGKKLIGVSMQFNRDGELSSNMADELLSQDNFESITVTLPTGECYDAYIVDDCDEIMDYVGLWVCYETYDDLSEEEGVIEAEKRCYGIRYGSCWVIYTLHDEV